MDAEAAFHRTTESGFHDQPGEVTGAGNTVDQVSGACHQLKRDDIG